MKNRMFLGSTILVAIIIIVLLVLPTTMLISSSPPAANTKLGPKTTHMFTHARQVTNSLKNSHDTLASAEHVSSHHYRHQLHSKFSNTAIDHHFTKKPSVTITSTHAPISIDGNADFAAQATSNGWPGDGSASNPYIIENLVIITNQDYTHAIAIRNTTVHFIIRNCTVSARGAGAWNAIEKQTSGIYLYNVTNGVLMNNVAHDNTFHGFYLHSSDNNTVSNNIASDNYWHGFYLIGSSNTVSYNAASDNYWHGFYLIGSSNTVSNNTASDNYWHGFYLIDSSNNTFIKNTASSNDLDGFYMYYATNNTFIKNIAYNNVNIGFYLGYGASGNVIMYNDFLVDNNIGNGQAYADDSTNTFDYNYWSDHTSPDADGDGIVDTPYYIKGPGGLMDPHPVTEPYHSFLPLLSKSDNDLSNPNALMLVVIGIMITGIVLGGIGYQFWHAQQQSQSELPPVSPPPQRTESTSSPSPSHSVKPIPTTNGVSASPSVKAKSVTPPPPPTRPAKPKTIPQGPTATPSIKAKPLTPPPRASPPSTRPAASLPQVQSPAAPASSPTRPLKSKPATTRIHKSALVPQPLVDKTRISIGNVSLTDAQRRIVTGLLEGFGVPVQQIKNAFGVDELAVSATLQQFLPPSKYTTRMGDLVTAKSIEYTCQQCQSTLSVPGYGQCLNCGRYLCPQCITVMETEIQALYCPFCVSDAFKIFPMQCLGCGIHFLEKQQLKEDYSDECPHCGHKLVTLVEQ